MVKPFGVVLFITNAKGEILSITRKGNDQSYGLVGGKVDETDLTPRHATKEDAIAHAKALLSFTSL